jgi:GNAT superfamily N-acetyltransferase
MNKPPPARPPTPAAHPDTAVTADPIVIRPLTGPEAHARVPELSAVLIDCVEGGASVSFMAPLTRERADGFWRRVADGVAAGTRILIVAEDRTTGETVGTVQLLLDLPENQPHRADVAKMLVRRSARRRGLGARLMRAVEDAARGAGRTLLVLDTVTGADADRLYERLGWTRVGIVPGYALWPDGRPCDTTIFYKSL